MSQHNRKITNGKPGNKSLNHYQNLIQNLPDLVCQYQPDGTLTFANQAYCRFFAKSQQDLVGKLHFDFIHPDDREKLAAQVTQVVQEKTQTLIEYRVINPQGEVRWHQWFITYIRDEANSQNKVLATGRDITELQLTHFKLNHRIAFERLISNLSINFINLHPEDFDNNINQMLSEIGQFTKVDRSYLFIADEEQKSLTNTHEWCNKGISPQIQRFKDAPFSALSWLMERLSNFETIFIPEVAELPVKAHVEKQLFKKQGVISLLLIPLVNASKLLGFIGFNSEKYKNTWKDDEVTILKIAGSITTNAIIQKNYAELITRQKENIETINQITMASLNSNNVEEMLNVVASQIGRLIDADDCTINLWDENLNQITSSAYDVDVSKYGDQVKIKPGEMSMTAAVLESEHPIAIEDLHASPYTNKRIGALFSTKSILGVPMIAGGRKLGSVLFGYHQTHKFKEEEIAIAYQATSQVAQALLKIDLLEKAQKLSQKAENLHKACTIVASTLHTDTAIQSILDQLSRVIAFDSASVQILMNNQLEIRDTKGWHPDNSPIGQKFPIPGNNPNSIVIQTRQPHVLNDAFKEQDMFEQFPYSSIRSWLGVPLIVRDQVIGMLTLDHHQPNYFNDASTINLVKAFADQVAVSLDNARLYAEKTQRVLELDALRTTTAEITQELALENLLSAILERATSLLNATGGELGLWDEEEDKIRILVSHNMGADTVGRTIKLGEGLMGIVSQTKNIEIIEDYQKWGSQLKAYQNFQIHAAIAAPLMLGKRFLGVIGVMHSDADRKFINSDLSLLNLFAQQAAIAVANAKLYEEQKHQSRMDITTDIYNRRGLLELGQRELERSRRTDQPLATIMVDIDFFKHTNDTYGHHVGDLVLQELAQRFKTQLRAVDILSRYGGEEFLILLPSTNQEEAYLIAERLRKTVASSPFTTANLSIPITISSGVAVIKENNATLSDLFSHADKAMYQSKKAGRNCVSVYGQPDKKYFYS